MGECGLCSPFCGCIPLRKAVLIIAIILIVWSALWMLMCLTYFGATAGAFGSSSGTFIGLYIISYFGGFIFAVFFLVICILLLLSSIKSNRRFAYIFLLGTIIVVAGCFVMMIIAEIWPGVVLAAVSSDLITGTDTGNISGYASAWKFFDVYWIGFSAIFWLWYPWWVVYCFYYELGGKPWSRCCEKAGEESKKQKPPQKSQKGTPKSQSHQNVRSPPSQSRQVSNKNSSHTSQTPPPQCEVKQ